jgi:hypothetical protein
MHLSTQRQPTIMFLTGSDQKSSVLLYSSSQTLRLRYMLDFIGREIAGMPFQWTDDLEYYKMFGGARLNYSQHKILDEEFWVKPNSLLGQKGIEPQDISCFETNGYKAFFKTGGDFPFDIFAACFYLLTRYEEYLPHKKDMYGRYAHENSVAHREGFLNTPLVNRWIEDFKIRLKEVSSA